MEKLKEVVRLLEDTGFCLQCINRINWLVSLQVSGSVLEKGAVYSILEYTAADGKRYKTQFYNLDAIISVGYRVNSVNATAFRKWATNVLREYLLQGYSVNRHLIALQENMDKRMTRIEDTQAKQQQQLDFFIRTSTPPAEMVFFEGDYFRISI